MNGTVDLIISKLLVNNTPQFPVIPIIQFRGLKTNSKAVLNTPSFEEGKRELRVVKTFDQSPFLKSF